MSLAFVRADGSMTWLGVGSVEGRLFRTDPAARPARASLVTRGGIVGSQLPQLRAEVIAVAPGDTLILATDGINNGFADRLAADAPPQQLADHLLARHREGSDDSRLLVARYAEIGR